MSWWQWVTLIGGNWIIVSVVTGLAVGRMLRRRETEPWHSDDPTRRWHP